MTWLILNPQGLKLAVGPGNNVLVRLDYPQTHQAGLDPGVELAIEMTPAQAREVGQRLAREADEAEAAQRRSARASAKSRVTIAAMSAFGGKTDIPQI
jgi:hypothetical protein